MIETHPYLEDLYDIYLNSVIWTVELIGIFETVKINDSQQDIFR